MNQRDTTYARRLAVVGGVLLIIAAVMEYWPSGNSLQWLDIEQARISAVNQKKPILVDVYAEWCGPCKNMDKNVFPDDTVQRILTSRYILAKINGDDALRGDTLRKEFHIRAYPTYIVLTPAGRERKRHVGFFPKSKFIEWLNDSTGVQILQWPDLDKALTQASYQKRRVMVLVLNSDDDIESANSLFEEPNVSAIVGKYFVTTLLVQSNPSDRKATEQLVFKQMTGALGEVIVLEGDRKEVGRFRVDPQMAFSTTALANQLKEQAVK
jgi:thiol-disulfide isomerase/thioredoxin